MTVICPHLLYIVLEAAGKGQVDDGSQAAHVHTHAKGNGGDNHTDLEWCGSSVNDLIRVQVWFE